MCFQSSPAFTVPSGPVKASVRLPPAPLLMFTLVRTISAGLRTDFGRDGAGRHKSSVFKNVFGKFFGTLQKLSIPVQHTAPALWERCCLTWHALLSLPLPPPWQVELSIQSGCMTHVWTPSTAFPWLRLWTSSSCVYTEDCLRKSQIWTTSGKYVCDSTISL